MKRVIDKGDFKHFMAKEIEEQPITLKNGINEYVDKSNNDINIYNFPWKINEISSVILIGCGTAYHSCLVAKYWFEQSTSLDVSVDIASEFRYRKIKFKKRLSLRFCFAIRRNCRYICCIRFMQKE